MAEKISRAFFERIKLSDEPAYKLAWKVGIHPVLLSKWLHGYEKPKHSDTRITELGKLLGLRPEECFSSEEGFPNGEG
jgi:transposase-like protein